MLVFSTRLQDRSTPMVIHMKDYQGPSQLVRYRSLVFLRTLLALNSWYDCTKAQLLPNLPPERHQEETLQMSYNLRFDFWLQHIEKPNPRADKQHLLKISPPFLQLLPLNFPLHFSQIFFKISFMISTSLIFGFNPKSQQQVTWDIPYN